MAPTLVCRDNERRMLAEATERVLGGQGGCVAVSGEVGVGKTSLLDEWVGLLRGRGVAVHTAAATEVDLHRPLAVLRRALPDLSPSADDDFLDELIDHAERLAAKRPLAILIDDLHWADALSLVALRALAERADELGLLAGCFTRQAPSSATMQRLLDRIGQLGLRRQLQPLDDRGLADLVEHRFGSECGPRLATALGATAGNPFLANEYLSGLSDDGLLSDDGSVIDLSSHDELPTSIVPSLSARAHAAVPGGELVIDALASLPDGTSPEEIAGVLDLPVNTVIRHCLTASTAGVLVERSGQLGFRHDLIRQAIAARTPAAVRKTIARQAGDMLVGQGGDPGRIAACWLAGCEWTAGHIDRLVELGRGFCGDHPFAAVALLQPALDEMPTDDPRFGPLVLEVGWALIATGRAIEVEALLDRWALESIGVGQAELEELRGIAESLSGGLDAVVDRIGGFDAARVDQIDRTTATPVELNRAAGAALLVAMSGQLRAAEAVVGWVTSAPGNDDPLCTAFVETVRAWVEAGTGRFESAANHARLAQTAAAADTSTRLGVAVPTVVLALANSHLGDLAGASSAIADALARTRQPRWGVPLLHVYQSMIHCRAGLWDDAVTELDAARHAASEADVHLDSFFPSEALHTLITNARSDGASADRSDVPGGEPDLDATSLGRPWQLWTRGIAAEGTGQVAALMPFIRDSVEAAEATHSPFRLLTGGADMAWWATRSGQVELGERITDHLRALAEESHSPVVHAIHQWAGGATTGDHLRIGAAADDLINLGYLTEGARAGRCATITAANAGDDTAARASAHLTFERCGELGAERWQHQLRADLRSRGLDVRVSRTPRQAQFGWDSLTPSETTVVKLLAGGLSNREIAQELVISRRTVESHLRRVYRKLDLTSRPQLLRAALEHDW